MATSQAQVNVGTALTFNGEAGADVALSFEGATDGNGQVSAQYDLGADPRDFDFYWNAEALAQATPDAGGTVDFYAAFAPDNDSTMIDGDVGASDATLTGLEEVVNLYYIGSLVWDTADTSKQVASGVFTCYQRYLSIVAGNNSGATMNATDSNFIFQITPFNIQGQAT